MKSKQNKQQQQRRKRQPAVQRKKKTVKQQRRSYRRVAGVLAGGNTETNLLRMLMLPADMAPRRMIVDPPQLTSVFNFQQNTTITSGTTPSAMAFFKDLAFPVWRTVVGTYTCSKRINMTYSTTGALGLPTFPNRVGISPLSITDATGVTFQSFSLGATPFSSEYYSDIVLGQAPNSGIIWFYNPGAFISLNASISSSLAGGLYTATFLYSPDGTVSNAREVTIDTTGTPGTTIYFLGDTNTSPCGWYTLKSINCQADVTTPNGIFLNALDVGWTTGGTLLVPTSSSVNGLYPIAGVGAAELTVAPDIYEGARMNAASVLIQTVTKNVDKEGALTAGMIKVPSGGVPTYPSAFGNYTNLLDALNDSAPAKRWEGLLENGFYTFMLPEMATNVMQDSQMKVDVNRPIFRLSTHNFAYVLTFTSITSTQTFRITYDVHHECINDSMLFPLGTTNFTLEEEHMAINYLLRTKPFTHNPTHVAAMLQAARSIGAAAWRRVRPYANPLAHKAVDYLIPKYQNLALTERQRAN